MDIIRVGLDFGTHQTKICIQRTPDEGHGVPEYEFFKFIDQKGNEQFFIPSVVQINRSGCRLWRGRCANCRRAIVARIGRYLPAGNGDCTTLSALVSSAGPVTAAAYTRAAVVASGVDDTASDGDVAAVTAVATANGGTVRAAGGVDGAAVDDDGATSGVLTAAYAGTVTVVAERE